MRFYHNLRAGGPLFETTLKELDALVTAHAEPGDRKDALYSLKSAVNWLLNRRGKLDRVGHRLAVS